MHDLLFERSGEWGRLPAEQVPDTFTNYARELGLDADRFAQDLEEHTYAEKVQSSYEDAASLGLRGTPTIIINGYQYSGGMSYEDLGAFIQLVQEFRRYESPPPLVIDPDNEYTATIHTNKGDIVAELFAGQAPGNVNSFAFLAQDGFYDGLTFFYVDADEVALSGNPSNATLNFYDAGYYCDGETSSSITFDEAGMLALYTLGPNRSTALFFITYKPQPDFDGYFTVIGRVIDGMDVARSLTATQPGPDQPAPDVIETIVIEER